MVVAVDAPLAAEELPVKASQAPAVVYRPAGRGLDAPPLRRRRTHRHTPCRRTRSTRDSAGRKSGPPHKSRRWQPRGTVDNDRV